jgi:ribosomal 30S subunit maturation factor RimM
MLISDLVAIGKLGKLIDEDGYIPFKPGKNFHPDLLGNIFLVFRNNSVRYVTVEEVKKNYRIKIDDSETAQTAADEGNVKVMLPKGEIDTFVKTLDIDDHVGKIIIFKSEVIGKVVEILNNSVYDLLVCELENKQELMIPLLDKFIIKINDENITVCCIEGLMEI